MILRGFLFCALLSFSSFAPLSVLALCAFAYVLFYSAYELIFLALIVDVFYGSGYLLHIPYYTVATIVGVFFIEWVKPYISVYNQ